MHFHILSGSLFVFLSLHAHGHLLPCHTAGMERPGKAELIADVDGLNERIEELKKLVALKEKEVSVEHRG